MIAALIFVGITIIVCTIVLVLNKTKKSSGILYFQESDSAMYLELNTAEIPKSGYVTLKIRRL